MIKKVSLFLMYVALLTGAGVLADNQVMAVGLQSPVAVTGTLGGNACTGYWLYEPLSNGLFNYLKLNNTGTSLANPLNLFTADEALAGNSTDPLGNVELCADIYPSTPPSPATPFFTGPPICLSGSFLTSGDTITACSLTSADWQSTDGTGKTLARRYYENFFAAHPNLKSTLMTACGVADDDYFFNNFFNIPNYQAAFSAPNISYINQNGDIRIGLAGLYNATPFFAFVLAQICPGFVPTVLAPFNVPNNQLQASQVVKVQVNGGNNLFLYGFTATSSGRYDDDDGDPSTVNPDCYANLLYSIWVYGSSSPPSQVCSYSGNYEFVLAFDFGDLPDQYGTLLGSNGARHYTLEKNNPYLGTPPDDEGDGQPTQDAEGDDLNYTDDEDGVTIPPLVIGTTVNIVVDYVNPLLGATVYLNAWLDIDGNGVLDQIATDTAISPNTSGQIQIPVTIPANATVGPVYGRFRISSQAGLGLTGPAPDGEVEDYVADIVEQPPPPPPGAPTYPLTVWLTMLGLALTTVFYRHRQNRR